MAAHHSSSGRRFRPRLESLEDRVTPTNLPAGFTNAIYASGLTAPTAMEFAPDGRLFILEQAGNVRMVDTSGILQFTPFLSLTVDSTGERGLLGIAFDPNFVSNNFFYVYYTATAGGVSHNRVSRFTAGATSAGNEVPLLDLPTLGATNHNGGAIHFGTDG